MRNPDSIAITSLNHQLDEFGEIDGTGSISVGILNIVNKLNGESHEINICFKVYEIKSVLPIYVLMVFKFASPCCSTNRI
jgi:hypothetical protein